MMENAGEVYGNQHLDLGRLSFYLQGPTSSPNQQLYSSSEPSWWCSLTRKLSGVQVCLIWALKGGVLPVLEPGLPTLRQKG